MGNKMLGMLLGATVVLGLTFASNALALEGENSGDRDLTVKEAIDNSSGREKAEIGEVEKETDHDIVSGREARESLHEDHESLKGEAHESGTAESHDSGTGSREPVDRLESR